MRRIPPLEFSHTNHSLLFLTKLTKCFSKALYYDNFVLPVASGCLCQENLTLSQELIHVDVSSSLYLSLLISPKVLSYLIWQTWESSCFPVELQLGLTISKLFLYLVFGRLFLWEVSWCKIMILLNFLSLYIKLVSYKWAKSKNSTKSLISSGVIYKFER